MANPLKDFDFAVLNDPGFKEDSVREEIIYPILREIGYQATGSLRVIRSRKLVSPFVMIGSKKQQLEGRPDYLLEVNNKMAFVLEAKSPDKDIESGNHVSQAYYYSIHPEINAQYYGLCNGKIFTVFQGHKLILSVRIDSEFAGFADLKKFLVPRNFAFDFLNDATLTGAEKLRMFMAKYEITEAKLSEETGYDKENVASWVLGEKPLPQTITVLLKHYEAKLENYDLLMPVVSHNHKVNIIEPQEYKPKATYVTNSEDAWFVGISWIVGKSYFSWSGGEVYLDTRNISNRINVLLHHPELKGRFAYNTNDGKILIVDKLPWDGDDWQPRHVNNNDFFEIRKWFAELPVNGSSFKVSNNDVSELVRKVAREHKVSQEVEVIEGELGFELTDKVLKAATEVFKDNELKIRIKDTLSINEVMAKLDVPKWQKNNRLAGKIRKILVQNDYKELRRDQQRRWGKL